MSALALAASFDGPSPVLSRVEAHLARAEARDRVFVTIPVTMLRALLAFAGVAARELESALLEAMTAAEQIPAEHRAAYLAARMEQLAIAHGMAPGGAPQPRRARKAVR